jgi:hypothetical protein
MDPLLEGKEVVVDKADLLGVMRARGQRTNPGITKSMIMPRRPEIQTTKSKSPTYSTFYFSIPDSTNVKHTVSLNYNFQIYNIEIQTSMNTWTIYKRYSELLKLHEYVRLYFNFFQIKKKFGKDKKLQDRIKDNKETETADD